LYVERLKNTLVVSN